MARTADHDARRDQLSQAAIDVALTEGLGRVTVARVSAVAGVSVGLVQHYFSTKRALMTRVYEDLLARADERVAEVVQQGEAAQRSIQEMAVEALSELLPLEGGRRAECLARAELETMAARDPELHLVAARHAQALQSRLAQVVQNAKRCGETPAHADTDHLARLLCVSVAGAATLQLLDPGFQGIDILRDCAARVFPHDCRQHG